MKGDFTRNTFDPRKHYRDVLMQQGRVQVDADWNEQAALTARRDETTAADIIGDCGGPADNAAFGVFTDPSKLSDAEAEHLKNLNIITPLAGGDFFLSAGRYYVDGIQCENEWPIPFSAQPDRRGEGPLEPGAYLLYLDVWQRHLTALEDSSIREPALGGPDHGTRAKTIWQVRALNFGPPGASDTDNPCGLGADHFNNLADPGTAKLTAGTAAQQAPKDPCLIPASAGYTGLENQLYRVEIHGPGRRVLQAGEVADDTEVTTLGERATPRPRFTTIWKWSRENGSVVTRIEKIDGKKITVSSLGPDKNLGFAKDAWVEILDDALELENNPGQLAQIDDVDEATRIITLKTPVSGLAPSDPNYPNGVMPEFHPKLRRWEGVASIQFGTWMPLESGVQVNFEPGGDYRKGHYWQIPARTATAQSPTGDIESPVDNAGNRTALSPFGITHHFCRLGIVDVKGDGSIEATDCRCLWPALTNVPRLFYVSGDGQEVMPTTTSGDQLGFNSANLFKLPRPLIVGLANAQCLEKPARVMFTIPPGTGNGLVASHGNLPVAQSARISTDAAGLARCDFHLDGTNYSQQVTAWLLDANDSPVSLPLIFNANLSKASEVAYDPKGCVALQGQKTVQNAIAHLASLTRLEALGGDGQDAEPGKFLTNPIRVLVISSCGPVANAHVQFDLAFNNQGSLTEFPSGTLEVKSLQAKTGGDGVASCLWKLDPDRAHPTQELTATLILADTTVLSQPGMLRFTANLRPGKDCCVTVGAGGDFADLEGAISELKAKRPEICICLLPGDHIVSGLEIVGATASALPITGGTTANAVGTNVVTPPPSPIVLRHLHIHGCGRASRILLGQTLKARSLASITLQDLCIYADIPVPDPNGLLPPHQILIENCKDVAITGCHLRQKETQDDWIVISEAERIHIADNVIESSARIKLIPIPVEDMGTAVANAAPTNVLAETAAANLAGKKKGERAAFIKEFRKIVKGVPGDDPKKKPLAATLKHLSAKSSLKRKSARAAVDATVMASIATPQGLADSVTGTALDLFVLVPALVIADANADTSIINNIITGEVRIYGIGSALSEEEFENLATRIHKPPGMTWDTTSTASTRSLRIEGNSLTKVVVSRDIVPPEGASTLKGLFARMSLLDNTFRAQGSEWLALHVISNGNYFMASPEAIRRIQLMATAVAASFICVGTSARWIASTLQYAVPPGDAIFPASTFFSQSANLFISFKPL